VKKSREGGETACCAHRWRTPYSDSGGGRGGCRGGPSQAVGGRVGVLLQRSAVVRNPRTAMDPLLDDARSTVSGARMVPRGAVGRGTSRPAQQRVEQGIFGRRRPSQRRTFKWRWRGSLVGLRRGRSCQLLQWTSKGRQWRSCSALFLLGVGNS
jgi:hypothetical protein